MPFSCWQEKLTYFSVFRVITESMNFSGSTKNWIYQLSYYIIGWLSETIPINNDIEKTGNGLECSLRNVPGFSFSEQNVRNERVRV
jgi:hypothetical protein